MKTTDQIIRDATNRLIRSVKARSAKAGKPITAESMHKAGYSKRFIRLVGRQ